MPADFVKINRTKQAGNQVVRLADILSEAQKICAQIVNMGGHTVASGVYTQLEDVFGLTTGDGDDLVALVSEINKLLNTTQAMTGQERADALANFTGRVGLQ